MRYYAYSSKKSGLTYYRDTNQREIDVVIEESGKLYPIEIKRSSNPDTRTVKAFDVLKATDCTLGEGAVICMTDRVFPINDKSSFVPAYII